MATTYRVTGRRDVGAADGVWRVLRKAFDNLAEAEAYAAKLDAHGWTTTIEIEETR